MPQFEIPGMPGANVGMINISEMLGKSMGGKAKKKKMLVKESHEILINEESDKLIEQDKIVKAAKDSTENNGIVFLDEIDKKRKRLIARRMPPVYDRAALKYTKDEIDSFLESGKK